MSWEVSSSRLAYQTSSESWDEYQRFEGFAFGGSSSNKKKSRKKGSDDDEDEDSGDEDDESLGSDAIDLATALDQWSESESGEEDESGSDDTSKICVICQSSFEVGE